MVNGFPPINSNECREKLYVVNTLKHILASIFLHLNVFIIYNNIITPIKKLIKVKSFTMSEPSGKIGILGSVLSGLVK